MNTPDITKAQITALVGSAIGVAVAFGVPISDTQSIALLGFTGVIASILFVSDAGIRRGRAKVAEAVAVTESHQAFVNNLPPTTPTPSLVDATNPNTDPELGDQGLSNDSTIYG